jgi:hypothetical protein
VGGAIGLSEVQRSTYTRINRAVIEFGVSVIVYLSMFAPVSWPGVRGAG